MRHLRRTLLLLALAGCNGSNGTPPPPGSDLAAVMQQLFQSTADDTDPVDPDTLNLTELNLDEEGAFDSLLPP